MDLKPEVTAITDDGNFKRSLLWTPDGQKLVYSYCAFSGKNPIFTGLIRTVKTKKN